jgi:DNA gyrase subunit A
MINLAKYLEVYKNHNIECIKKETEFDHQKLLNRIEILEGLSKALEDIDNVIKVIKESKTSAEAKTNLVEKYSLTEPQVNAILNMKLNRLANMERVVINNELQEKKEKCLELEDILKSEDKQINILKERLRELAKKFGNERRTEVVQKEIASTSKAKKEK